MKYSVDKQDNEFVVLEAVTNYELGRYEIEDDAHRLCSKLNMGMGFQGKTPKFFTIKVNIPDEEL